MRPVFEDRVRPAGKDPAVTAKFKGADPNKSTAWLMLDPTQSVNDSEG